MNAPIWSAKTATLPPPLWPEGVNSRASMECMSGKSRVRVAAPPLGGPARKLAGADRRAHRGGQTDQEPYVMQRQQAQSEQLFRHEEMPQISAAVRHACLAIAAFIER